MPNGLVGPLVSVTTRTFTGLPFAALAVVPDALEEPDPADELLVLPQAAARTAMPTAAAHAANCLFFIL